MRRINIQHLILSLCTLLTAVSCTDQRDLYVKATPLFIIKNDWQPSKLTPENATAMLYGRANPSEPFPENPYRHSLFLERGGYDILIFNDAMYYADVPNLEGVIYRNIDKFETFGAYAKPSPVSYIFRSDDQPELMIGYNYPSHVATRSLKRREVLSDVEYQIKYRNGKNGFPYRGNYEADSVEFVPIRVTRDVKVIAHVKNLKNKFRISGALRSFAEGVILSSRQPHGANATYTFDMNSAVEDPDVPGGHIIVSELFTTFGPWWNDYPSSRKYTLDIYAAFGSEVFPFDFDVTEVDGVSVTRSVGQAIVEIKYHEKELADKGTYPLIPDIILEIWFSLPTVVDEQLNVGVVDWGDDIIIPVPL